MDFSYEPPFLVSKMSRSQLNFFFAAAEIKPTERQTDEPTYRGEPRAEILHFIEKESSKHLYTFVFL